MTDLSADDCRQRIADRLSEANLDPDRFINVTDGSKASRDHTHRTATALSGNYGIHAEATDCLVLADVDEYDDDQAAAGALAGLPPTFTQESPHGGEHALFRIEVDSEGRYPAAVFKDEFETKNPHPSWGEVRVANQYVVGAGSQLGGCDKDWCDACEDPDGGYYRIKDDREIATVDAETFVDVLRQDPDLTAGEDADDTGQPAESTDLNLDDEELIKKAKNAKNGDAFASLWRGDTSAYNSDHSRADLALCNHLVFWTQGDRGRIDNLFRQSGLMREKWDRDDYREGTIDKALSNVTDHYDPSTSKTAPPDPEDVTVEVTDTGERRELPTPDGFAVLQGSYGRWYQAETDEGTVDRFDEWTNFQLEVLSFTYDLHGDGTDKTVHLRVWPATDEEEFEVEVPPTVFNEKREFKAEVCAGLTTTFSGGEDELNALKRFVGQQDAPTRIGTHQMGLHGDEFVTPDGVLTADGWTDDSEHVHRARDVGAERKWSLAPDTADEWDVGTVGEIVELLPQTRNAERFLPVLSWFYAAPLRPHIMEWSGQFNLLSVLGETGAGKTTSLSLLWQMFGMDSEPLSADDTKFALLTSLASTNSVPIWFDEYKPSDMQNYRVDAFKNEVRKSTRGGVATRGNADRSTEEYHLNAPVVVSGEERVTGSAEERRGIYTTLRKDVTTVPDCRDAFARLTGGQSPDGEYHEGHELREHALAYYQWSLGRSADDLRETWRGARTYVRDLLADHDVEIREDLVEQGLQTIKFGADLYRGFAESVGATPSIGGDEIEKAILYVATESAGGANRKSHMDAFFEVLGRAANEGYLEADNHYTFVREGQPNEELRVNLNRSFDKVVRYAREHDVGEDLLNTADDYRERIKEANEEATSYISAYSQKTPPISKCVGLHVEFAEQELDGFERLMFLEGEDRAAAESSAATDGDDDDDGDGDGDAPTERNDPLGASRLADVATDPTGYATVTAEVLTVEYPEHEDAPALRATVKDTSTAIDVIAWHNDATLAEGDTILVENAEVSEYHGKTQLVIRENVTTTSRIQQGVGHTPGAAPEDGQGTLADDSEAGQEAATDGGESEDTAVPVDAEGSNANATRLCEIVRSEGGALPRGSLFSKAGERHDVPPEDAQRALARATTDGRLIDDGETIRSGGG